MNMREFLRAELGKQRRVEREVGLGPDLNGNDIESVQCKCEWRLFLITAERGKSWRRTRRCKSYHKLQDLEVFNCGPDGR